MKLRFSAATIFLLLAAGCMHPLKKWVTQRGYEFNSDYSTQSPLGYEVTLDQRLRINPNVYIHGRRASLPDLVQASGWSFRLRGPSASAPLLNRIFELTGSTLASQAFTANLELRNPYNEEADAFIPLTPCANRRIPIVSKVLNAGGMTLRVFTRSGLDITGTLKLKEPATLGLDSYAGSSFTIQGSSFYVGYQRDFIRCRAKLANSIFLSRENSEEFTHGILARLISVRGKREDGSLEALISIVPSLFNGEETSRRREHELLIGLKSGESGPSEMETDSSPGQVEPPLRFAPSGQLDYVNADAPSTSADTEAIPAKATNSQIEIKDSTVEVHAATAKELRGNEPRLPPKNRKSPPMSPELIAAWEGATTPLEARAHPATLFKGKLMRVKYGDSFGVPANLGSRAGIYLEVHKVTQDSISLEAQRIEFEFADDEGRDFSK